MVCIVNDRKYLTMELGSVPAFSILHIYVASVDLMNQLVVYQMKHNVTEVAKQFYECSTGQLAGCYLVYKICFQFLKLQYAAQFQSTVQLATATHNTAQLMFLGRKILDKKILVNPLQFAKFSKIFSIQNLYHMVLYSMFLSPLTRIQPFYYFICLQHRMLSLSAHQ